ncbi:MAG: glycosyltransferase family 4 protein [Planctomycetota bacterium]|jgi:glycosyltransferase involved in cell wall biosynthesis
MRVLLLNQVFYPDVAATAQHAHDLARHLVDHGHEVHVITSRSLYGQRGAALPAHEIVDGIEVHRVGRSLFGKAGILARVTDFALFFVAAAVKSMAIPRVDVVICLTTPPFIALVGVALRWLRQSALVYWVMDLYPDLPVACGVMSPRSPITWLCERVNRFCLRCSDRVVVLGRCMQKRVADKGVDRGQVVHIGVWADPEEVTPIEPHESAYREKWSLGDKIVVMYSGNFGLGHDVETMCGAAERLYHDSDFRFVFAGGGKKRAIVDEHVRSRGLDNVVLAPYQPREELGEALACADIHLVSLLNGVEGIMVPCKLQGIMAAARPTIFIGHQSSEIARVLGENRCGLCVRQGEVDGLVNAIRNLAQGPRRRRDMGERARAALVESHSRERACETWRELLESLVDDSSASTAGSAATLPPGRDAA